VVAIAHALVPEVDALIAGWLGADRAKALHTDLDWLHGHSRL
jgi:hypothetical protein